MKTYVGLIFFLFSSLAFNAEVRAGDEKNDEVAKDCTNILLKGSYAFYQVGEVVGKGPAADVGILNADGKGTFTGEETVHVGSSVFKIIFMDGTYQIDPNCTGTLRWIAVLENGPSIGERTATITIAKRSKEVYVLSTAPGSVLVGVAKQ